MEKKIPLKLRQQRLLNPSAEVPHYPLHTACPALALFNTKPGSSQTPAGRQTTQPGPKKCRKGGTCPHSATPNGFCLAGLTVLHCSLPLDGGFTNRRWLPEPLKAPELGLSSTHTGSGVCAWLGSAGAKAHLIHSIQLGHLFPVAGPQEIAVQSHYPRQSLWSALSNFVTGYQWPGIPKLGLLPVLWFLNTTPRKFPFSTENRRTAKEMTHKW